MREDRVLFSITSTAAKYSIRRGPMKEKRGDIRVTKTSRSRQLGLQQF